MLDSRPIALRAIPGLAAIALALTGSSSFAMLAPGSSTHATQLSRNLTHRPGSGSQDLYIGNILGGVLLYSTGKNQHQVGDIRSDLPRVTGVWVDHAGVLYAFTDNPQYPYETIEEFQPGSSSPFFSLTLQHYGLIVAADANQNVYAQGVDGSGQSVIDVYPPASQSYSNEYVVPKIGNVSGPQGMAFDSTGTLLVGVGALANNRQGEIGQVFRLDARSSKFVSLRLKKAYGGLIATDAAGNLYVGGGQLISVYPPGATSPSRTVRATDTIVALTAASDGTLYVDTYQGGITVYAPGSNRTEGRFTPQAQVSGLALGPR